MSGYGNKFVPKEGTGNLFRPKTPQPNSPTFSGQAMIHGQLMSVSIWHKPAGPDPKTGQMKQETFSVKVQPWVDRPPQGQQQGGGYAQQPPQQQAMQYGAPPHQQQYAPQQHAPQPATGYQPHPHAQPAPQGYPPQGGYVPTPSAAPQPAPQPQPGYGGGSYGAPGATFDRSEIPF